MGTIVDSFLPDGAAISAARDALPGSSRRTTTPQCRHCGAPNPPEAEFCCAGCEYVHRLVREQGLDDYYKFKDTITVPVDPAVFESRDYEWLRELQQGAERASGDGAVEMTLGIQGIACAACGTAIHKRIGVAEEFTRLGWVVGVLVQSLLIGGKFGGHLFFGNRCFRFCTLRSNCGDCSGGADGVYFTLCGALLGNRFLQLRKQTNIFRHWCGAIGRDRCIGVGRCIEEANLRVART
jgi:hypothetical protein